jgi:hypothetical protein
MQGFADSTLPVALALVNARRTYWASNNQIPGGMSFENVELMAPFQSGQTWAFGVTTDPPTAFVRDESTPDAAKD